MENAVGDSESAPVGLLVENKVGLSVVTIGGLGTGENSLLGLDVSNVGID